MPGCGVVQRRENCVPTCRDKVLFMIIGACCTKLHTFHTRGGG
jgi:hypothetical protein